MRLHQFIPICLVVSFLVRSVHAQDSSVSLATSIDGVPIQTGLPNLLRMHDGSEVTTLEQWQRRREELKDILLHYQYGAMPPRPDRVRAEQLQRRQLDGGLGTAELLNLIIESDQQPAPLKMQVLVFVPHDAKQKGPLPVIIREEGRLNGNEFVPTLLQHGYIFIEYARHELDPDRKDTVGPAQQAYRQFDWATLAVWAWGGMRVVDYLETRDEVDMKRIAITGHSRGGKMALLTGALDDRIALVVPVQSGAGGAGSYTMLGPGGESLTMNDKPHWYADRIQMFLGKADRIPFDQHFLKALVAPRALLCLESVDDDYANPVGTQLTTIAAQPAFDLYGSPAADNNAISYRNGRHSFNNEDWARLLTFAEWKFRGRPPADPSVYRARPYDLPERWFRTDDSAVLHKGIASERVRDVYQAQAGPAGYALIGDPSNEADEDHYGMGRFGAVGYSFEMLRRQVTWGQYVEFLNAVARSGDLHGRLYDTDMPIRQTTQAGVRTFAIADDKANWAATHTSWFDALRYCNWLHNGKPIGPMRDGTTEDGAYRLADGDEIRRQPGAKFAVPTHHEWHKAAYYDRDGGYRLYHREANGELNVVQHAAGAESGYGVSGMYDRLWEWNENRVHGLFRSVRCGAWFVGNNRQAAGHLYSNPELRLPNIGFRVVRLGRVAE